MSLESYGRRWLAMLLFACASSACKHPPVATRPDAASAYTPAVTMTPLVARREGEAVYVASVELREDGTMRFNGVVMRDDDALRDAARAAIKDQPHVEAQIIAEANVTYARVIHAMDLLRMGGIRDVSFGVAQPAPIPVSRDR